MATKEKINPVNKGGSNTEWGAVNQNAEKVLELKSRIKNSTPVEQFLANEPLEFVNQDNLEQLNKSKVEVEKVQPKVPAKSKTRAVTKTKGELTTKPRKTKSTNTRQFAQVQELEQKAARRGTDEPQVKSLGQQFVDDKFENFVELNKNGICCFLMDAPHNQRYDVGHKRIKSLKELK